MTEGEGPLRMRKALGSGPNGVGNGPGSSPVHLIALAVTALLFFLVWRAVIEEAPARADGAPRTLEVRAECPPGTDSAEVYPSGVRLGPGDTVQLTAVCWRRGRVWACSGVCDTIPAWLFDGVPEAGVSM